MSKLLSKEDGEQVGQNLIHHVGAMRHLSEAVYESMSNYCLQVFHGNKLDSAKLNSHKATQESMPNMQSPV